MKFRRQVQGLALGVTAMVAAASAVSAQALLPTIWQIDSTSTAFFPGGDAVRGMAFNPATGNLLALSRTAVGTNPNIQVISGATGAVGTPMNATGFSGGTFSANKIQAVDRGAGNYSVYVANLASSSETSGAPPVLDPTVSLHPTVSSASNPAFRIYRYTGAGAASEDTIGAPTLIYRNNASPTIDGYAGGPVGPDLPIPLTDTNSNTINDAYRIGDTMDVEYDAINNVTRLYLPYRQVTPATLAANAFLVFTIDEATGTVTSVDRFTVPATGNSYYSTIPFGANTVYHATNGQFARYVNADATPGDFEVQTTIGNLGNAVVTEPHIFEANGKTFVAYIRGGEGTAFSAFRIGEINPAGSLENTFSVQTVNRGAGQVANGNGSAEFHYDAASGRLYGLVGNNIIAAVQFGDPTGPNTKTWDGGGDGLSYADPANWAPNGVPVPAQDVLLDNSNVAGSYSVTLPTASTVFAHTLTVGYPANPNNIQAIISSGNTQSVALHILSSPVTGTDDVRVSAGGILRNSSTAASGDVLFNRNVGATMAVFNGGTYEHNSARSFGTPFPPSGNGAISFTSNATMIFDVPSGGAFSFSGRTYGNLVFQAQPNPYTAAGASASVVAGDLTVEAGAALNLSGHTGSQTFQGNINANGTALTLGGPAAGATLDGNPSADVSGGLVTYAAGFEIPAGRGANFQNGGTAITVGSGQVNGTLDINAPGGHSLNGTVEINSGATLALTSGVVDTSAGTLRAELGSTVNQVNGWASPDFTNEVAAATGAYAFPIGNASEYLPVGISFPANGPDVLNDITVSNNDGDHPTVAAPNQPTALNRWWNITASPALTPGTFGANLVFSYADPADVLPAINELDLKIGREITPASGNFITYPTTVNSTLNTLTTAVPIVAFSDWTAFEDAVLAADVTSFTAKQTGATVLVSWETAAELDNAGFVVYRANEDGSRGEKLSGLIPAEGSASAGASYSFVDSAAIGSGETSRSYLLVDIDLSGAEGTHGPATATISTGTPSSVTGWTMY